jgi:hypothetical protein
MQRLMVLTGILVYCLFVSLGHAASRDTGEQISNYASFVSVNPDTSLDITEDITVYANEHKIRHGLVRWLPTNYFDSHGLKHRPSYQIQQVLINNQPSAYRIENKKDRIVIYTGERDSILKPGEYTYRIKYHVKDALQLLANADALTWSITSNSWDFPILKTQGTIQLPKGTVIAHYAAYTGKLSTPTQDYIVTRPAVNQIIFTTTKPLARNEGLRITLDWPKGVMKQPTLIQKIHKNSRHSLPFEFTGVLALYAILIALLYGRSPRKNRLGSIHTPPFNLSPAVMRFILRMGFDVKVFTATITNMAAKKFLTINDVDGDIVLIRQTQDTTELSAEEKIVAEKLFALSSTMKFSKNNMRLIKQTKKALRSMLQATYKNQYFISNLFYLLPGWIFAFIALVVNVVAIKNDGISWVLTGLLLITLGISIFLFYLIKVPTVTGRKLMDQIEGFKMFLAKGELMASEKTHEVLQKYLPYAIALDVEKPWRRKFLHLSTENTQEESTVDTLY